MVVVPLPPLVLDALFSFNIAISLVVLLAVVYVQRPLDFTVFPIILLTTTMLRLALNVASTRVILLHGQDGHDAAGKVIAAFGEFVVGGNYAVGIVVFAILTIINFVVITKGAGRISEVTARFILDAMPGQQMAIDADLNAGLLTRAAANARRRRRLHLHPAVDRRRPGGAAAGPAGVLRGGDAGHPRLACPGHGQGGGRPGLWPAQGAGGGRGHPAGGRRGAGHAQRRFSDA